jgi:hypothetical protein
VVLRLRFCRNTHLLLSQTVWQTATLTDDVRRLNPLPTASSVRTCSTNSGLYAARSRRARGPRYPNVNFANGVNELILEVLPSSNHLIYEAHDYGHILMITLAGFSPAPDSHPHRILTGFSPAPDSHSIFPRQIVVATGLEHAYLEICRQHRYGTLRIFHAQLAALSLARDPAFLTVVISVTVDVLVKTAL